MPRTKADKRILNVAFSEELFTRLQKAARERTIDDDRPVSMNEIVRLAVREYLTGRARRFKSPTRVS